MTAHKWQFASRFRRQAFGWRSDLPDVDARTRQRWLDRLWQAINDDDMPYIETLAERWGELCGTRELASAWADDLLPILQHVWHPDTPRGGYFKGTSACLACLYAAGRHEELLALLATAPHACWAGSRIE